MDIVFIAGIAEKIRTWFQGFFGAVLSIIPKTFYFLCTLVFQVLDLLQLLVRKLAGLDVVYYSSEIFAGTGGGTSEPQSGDIVLEFIETIFMKPNSILSNIFWALIVLALILLIISTFVAVLRSEYSATDSKSASKGRIIGRAFKAIASFAIVPIVCFFGVFMANVVLQALDTISAGSSSSQLSYTYETPGEGGNTTSISSMFEQKTTSTGQDTYISYNFWGDSSGDGNNIPTSSTPISGLIFKAAAFKANRIRYDNTFRSNVSNPAVGAGVFNNFGSDFEQAATLMDECFANAYELKNAVGLTTEPFKDTHMFPFGGDNFIGNHVDTIKVFDKNNVQDVWYFYDLWQFDFILGIAAVVVCAKLLVYLVFGLMKRIFELVVLFLIAAPIASIMPIDDGEALKKWRQKFVSKVLSAYAPIVGLNLFFVILPIVTSIKYFNIALLDAIVNMFFTIVGLIMVKDLIQTLSELIGADNALKAGQDMAGEVGQTLAKVGQLAAAPVGMAVKGAKMGMKAAKWAGGKITKGRENKALDEHNLANMNDEQAAVYDGLGGSDRRKMLREMRDSMSAEDRQSVLSDYYQSDNAPRKYRRQRLAKEKFADKAAQAAADSRSAMQAAGMSQEEWRGLSQTERDDAISAWREGREQRNADLESYNASNERISNLTAERDRILEEDRTRYLRMQTFGYMDEDALDEAYDNDSETIRNQTRLKEIDEEIANERNNINNIISGYGGSDGFNDMINAMNNKKQNAQISDDTRQQMARAKEIGGFLKNSMLNNPDEWAKAGQFLAGGFAKSLADNLTPIFNTLAGDMAKGWKDAGGAGGIEARLKGLAGKEEKLNEAIKEQKRILAAQDKASQLLGRNRGPATQTVRLDDASLNQLAKTIQDQLKK